MRLETIEPWTEIFEPSENDIIQAISKVYADEIDVLLLEMDAKENQYMQAPQGGMHIEYCVSNKGPIYSCDGVPAELAEELFLSYLRGDGKWQERVNWKIEIETL